MANPNQKTSTDQRKNLAILVVVGVILILLIAIVYMMRSGPSNAPSAITVNGTLECLPHKNPGEVETLECATGLKTDDNRHYGLTNLPDDPISNATNTRVQVKGEVTNPAADYNYDVVGIIKVEAITKE